MPCRHCLKGELIDEVILIRPDPVVTLPSSSETASRCPCLTCKHCESRPDQYMFQLRCRSFEWVAKRCSQQHHLVIKGSFGFDWSVCSPDNLRGALDKVIYNNTAVTFCFRWKWMNSSPETVEGGKREKENHSVQNVCFIYRKFMRLHKNSNTWPQKKRQSESYHNCFVKLLFWISCSILLNSAGKSMQKVFLQLNHKKDKIQFLFCFFFPSCGYLNRLHILNYLKSS